MRLVDADVLKQKYTMATIRYSGGIMERPVVVLEAVDEAPSVDIVRCRECKHWLDGSGLCKHWSKLYGSVLTKADDFCSYGEREGE